MAVKNAVIYARYSSDSQREESIDGQLRECKEFAERQNLTIVGTYIDRALSAKTDSCFCQAKTRPDKLNEKPTNQERERSVNQGITKTTWPEIELSAK